MRKYLAIGVMLLLGDFAFASAKVTDLPVPVRLFAECETNVQIKTTKPKDNIWKLNIQVDTSVTNCLEVAFGFDGNFNGILDLDESDFYVGWDCGQWYWIDDSINNEERVVMNGNTLHWNLRLDQDKRVRSASNDFFSNVPYSYNPGWNLMRVVSRGVNTIFVESKFSLDALKLSIR